MADTARDATQRLARPFAPTGQSAKSILDCQWASGYACRAQRRTPAHICALRASAHLRATSRVACAEPALALTSRAPAPTFLAWLNQLTGTSSFRAQTFPGLPRLSLGRPVMPPGQSVTFLLDRQAGLTLTNIPGRALAGGTSALAARGRLTSALRRSTSKSGRRTRQSAEPVGAKRAAFNAFRPQGKR